jgi:hypothetical protein
VASVSAIYRRDRLHQTPTESRRAAPLAALARLTLSGIDVHKKVLMVVVRDPMAKEEEWERGGFGNTTNGNCNLI